MVGEVPKMLDTLATWNSCLHKKNINARSWYNCLLLFARSSANVDVVRRILLSVLTKDANVPHGFVSERNVEPAQRVNQQHRSRKETGTDRQCLPLPKLVIDS